MRFDACTIALFVWTILYFPTAQALVQQQASSQHAQYTLFLAITDPNSIESNIQRGIRGNNYGVDNNSTIPTAVESALAVGVQPPLNVSAAKWKRAWKIHRRAMPILHSLDRHCPPDSSLSLMCLWWKALAANTRNSPVNDDQLSYDLLPRGFRILVSHKLARFYPRLHHANVEIRTAYLNKSIRKTVQSIRRDSQTTRIRLVSLGSGYDVRSIQLRQEGIVDAAVELDLSQVVEGKQGLWKRLQKRRPEMSKDLLPEIHPIDLNHVDQVEKVLTTILQTSPQDEDWYTVFLFEGVMIYLNEGIPEALLKVCSEVLRSNNANGSLVFADRLENIPGGDYDIAKRELAKNGWNLTDWLPKPGLARHMGCAELL